MFLLNLHSEQLMNTSTREFDPGRFPLPDRGLATVGVQLEESALPLISWE